MNLINALHEIDAVIARLRDGDEDQVREAVSRLAWLFGQVAERKKAYQQALLAWVDAHDGRMVQVDRKDAVFQERPAGVVTDALVPNRRKDSMTWIQTYTIQGNSA